MKLKLSILFFLITASCFPAARFWVGGAANWDNTAGTKWSTTSGGSGGSAVPTNADDVHLDAGTGTGSVTVTIAAVCKTLDCTGYVNTLTFNNTITVSGAVTFVSGMTIAGTSNLQVNTTATLTSGGKTLTGGITFGGTSQTYTLADAWVVTGDCSSITATTSVVINGNTLTFAGNFVNTRITTGTTLFICNGTGTWSGGGSIANGMTINTAGTFTINSISITGGVFTYTAGTISGTKALAISVGCTLNVSGITWGSIITSGSIAITLTGDLNNSGLLTIGTSFLGFSGAYTIYTGGLSCSNGDLTGSGGFLGLVFNGTGTWGTGTGTNRVTTTINTSGTLTISGTVKYTGTLTYTAGTIVTTSSTLNIQGSSTLAASGITWVNVTVASASIITLNSILNASGTLTVNASTTFAGSAGFSIADFSATTAGNTITFTAGNTYTMTHGCIITGTAALAIALASSSPGTRYNFILNNGAPSLDLGYVTATDADSSLGRTMWNYKGTDNNTVNWALLGNPITIGMPFCR